MTNERRCANCGAPESTTSAGCYYGYARAYGPHSFSTASPAAQARVDEPRETGWVIEKRDPEGVLNYWRGKGWSRHHGDAIRFARRVDAADIEQMFHLDGAVVEHMWVPTVPPSASPAEAEPPTLADSVAFSWGREMERRAEAAESALSTLRGQIETVRTAFDALLIREVQVWGGIPVHSGRTGKEHTELREAIAALLATFPSPTPEREG